MPAKLHASDFKRWNGDAKFDAQMLAGHKCVWMRVLYAVCPAVVIVVLR